MYKPKEGELKELWLKEIEGWKYYILRNKHLSLQYSHDTERFEIYTRIWNEDVYPESIEDIKTLIRLFKLK